MRYSLSSSFSKWVAYTIYYIVYTLVQLSMQYMDFDFDSFKYMNLFLGFQRQVQWALDLGSMTNCSFFFIKNLVNMFIYYYFFIDSYP